MEREGGLAKAERAAYSWDREDTGPAGEHMGFSVAQLRVQERGRGEQMNVAR